MIVIKGLKNKNNTLNLSFGDLRINADNVVITEFNLEGGEKELIEGYVFTTVTTPRILKLTFIIPPFKINGDNNFNLFVEEK